MGGIRSERHTASGRKPTLVLNATPLIYLSKCGLADKLRHLKKFRLVTTREVYREVYVKGDQKGVSETGVLKKLFESQIVEVLDRIATDKKGSGGSKGKKVIDVSASGIHRGESTVISLALDLDAIAIMDDKRARHIARVLGVKLSSTPNLIIELVKLGVLSKEESKHAIDSMIDAGWYCSAKAYSEILLMIEAIQFGKLSSTEFTNLV